MDGHRTSRRRFLAAVGAAAGAGAAGCVAAPGAQADEEEPTQPTDRDLAEQSLSTEGEAYAVAYRERIDSVVEIQVLGDDGSASQGTGWVYDNRHLVTNQHVVSDLDDVWVRFRETGWKTGSVVATDVYSDLAVVRLADQPEAAAPLPLLQSDPPIGTRVIAIGNPFGYSGSVSAGIVSGLNRTLPAANNFNIPDAIQTDAAVNPGNSGGPLIDLEGNCVGIINSGSGDSIGFAISAPLIRRVVPELISVGNYDHPYMGVQLTSVSPLIARANDLNIAEGVYIAGIVEGGPSEGVLQGTDGSRTVNSRDIPTGGDVVVRMDDTPIPSSQALSSFLALETEPGQTVEVEVIRDGGHTTVDLTLGSRPEP